MYICIYIYICCGPQTLTYFCRQMRAAMYQLDLARVKKKKNGRLLVSISPFRRWRNLQAIVSAKSNIGIASPTMPRQQDWRFHWRQARHPPQPSRCYYGSGIRSIIVQG